jgi:NADH-quinone oxidoreductase subunit B
VTRQPRSVVMSQLPAVPPELQPSVRLTTLDRIYAWVRQRSLWPMAFGWACCAYEMAAATASRYDVTGFGLEAMQVSPRQADLLVVNGTVTKKMAPLLLRLYDQMAEPKSVIAMGACAISGGPFKEGYNVVPGVDRLIPVDVYIPGCPPRLEALLHGILTLQARFGHEFIKGVRASQAEEGPRALEQPLGPESRNLWDLAGFVGPGVGSELDREGD